MNRETAVNILVLGSALPNLKLEYVPLQERELPAIPAPKIVEEPLSPAPTTNSYFNSKKGGKQKRKARLGN